MYSTGNGNLTSTSYNAASLATQVNFGSGDSDTFSYDSNTDRMTQYQFNVGSQSVIGKLTWNSNGSLGGLAITDPFNSANSQNCSYTHDDLGRVAGTNCSGSGFSGTYSYDAFGNLKKSGTDTFQPTYNSATNQMTSIGGQTPSYDADGNVLNDYLNSYSWDAYGRPVTIDGVNVTYDALGRMVEENENGTYTEFQYSPTGFKMQDMNGQASIDGFVPLPGGAMAVWGPNYYRHSDWIGSGRLASNWTGGQMVYDLAYGPFGEPYAQSGSTVPNFTGMDQHTAANVYDFPMREYGIQGRWPSPDPAGVAAVDPTDPQTWNRYAYVRNSPLEMIDPLGLDGATTTPCPPGSSPNEVCTVVTVTANPNGGSAGGSNLEFWISYLMYMGSIAGWTEPYLIYRGTLGGGGGAGGTTTQPQKQTPQQKNQQCLNQINNTPDGKFYNFFSPLSMIPGIGPDWKGSIAEDVGGSAAKFAVFKFFQGVSRNMPVNPFGSFSGAVADTIEAAAEGVAVPLMGAATVGQVTVHAGCYVSSHF